MKFERITKFTPAFDKRHPDPKKNYGIKSVHCFMILKGDKGAVQFTFSTGMFLPETIKEYYKDKKDLFHYHYSGGEGKQSYYMGYDVGYHSPKPMFKEQTKRDDCPFIKGGGCYYDGSSLRAETWMKIFVSKGSEKIWKMLEKEYKALFLV